MPSASSVFSTAGNVNGMLLRPFRQRVDLTTVTLLMVLLLVIAGQWHLVLERVEI